MNTLQRVYLAPLLILCALASGGVAAAEMTVGKAITVIGDVRIAPLGEEGARQLRRMDPIQLNDTVTTAAEAQAKLLLNDDSILKVAPASQLRVSQSVVGTSADEKTVVDLLKGRVRSLVGKRLGAAARFEVHTKEAVAGVRGTDFIVWIRPDGSTVVRCYEGSIEVSSSDPAVGGSVLLGPNTYSVVGVGKAPTPPVPIAPDQLIPGERGSPSGQSDSNEVKLLQLEIQDFETMSKSLPGVELDLGDRLFYVSEPLDDELFTDFGSEQVDTYPYPGGVRELPLDIQIPTPGP